MTLEEALKLSDKVRRKSWRDGEWVCKYQNRFVDEKGTLFDSNDFPDFDWEPYTSDKETFDTGSQRDARDGKGRFDLLPVEPIRRLAIRLEEGAKKYGERNWEKGQPLMRYLDSAMRHLCQLVEGQTDEDHAAAVLFNVAAYIWTEKEINEGRLPKELGR